MADIGRKFAPRAWTSSWGDPEFKGLAHHAAAFAPGVGGVCGQATVKPDGRR